MILGELLETLNTTASKELEELGLLVGRAYTDHGLPIDMALDRLSLTKTQKVVVLMSAQGWIVQHKRNSGATDKAIDRTRKTNLEAMTRFIHTNETGIY